MKYTLILLSLLAFFSCGEKSPQQKIENKPVIQFKNDAHELIYKMSEKVGTYQQLRALKDVSYLYTYITADGQMDVSNEKYIFDGELSYGAYQQHDRTLAQLEGEIEQGFNGNSFWLKHEGELLEDEQYMKRVIFNRKTNFYWFTMMQKLLDPGLNYEYIAEQKVDGKMYDVVKVSFSFEGANGSDIYQLYINRETLIADQFLFTVVDFNVMETPFLMKMTYEEIDGILIPTNRKYTKANWNGEILSEQWTSVQWSDIQFDNDFSKQEFEASNNQ